MSVRKWIIAVGTIAMLVCLAMLVVSWGIPRSPIYRPCRPLRPEHLSALGKAVGFRIPEVDDVENIALLHGKDSTLFIRIVVPNDYARELLRQARARGRAIEASHIGKAPRDLSWFEVSSDEVVAAFIVEDYGYYQIVFCRPRPEGTRLYVEVGSGTKRLSRDVYSIFSR